MDIKPPNLSIGVTCSPYTRLIDRRIATKGIVFGTIEGVAKQYGIKMENTGKFYKFSAPKSRLQIFAEKLHFSRVPYFSI